MTLADQIAETRAELDMLYGRQAQAERADLDGRVTDRALWRESVDRRAERIRQTERTLASLEREFAQAEERDAA